MSDPSRPLINITVPGPVLLLDLFPHTLFYVVIVLVDYYICCRTSIPYAKLKSWYISFHVLLPFLIGPTHHGFTTPFTVAPWFVASVGAFCSQKYKHQQTSSPQPFLCWLKSIGYEGFVQQQRNDDTTSSSEVRMEGLKRCIGVVFVMSVGNVCLTPLLLEDYNEFFKLRWYSMECIYYGFLMGLKGYTLMISNDILSSVGQMVTGYRIVPVFNKPFLATSPKDFWGNRWNLIMRHLLRKQVYAGVKEKDYTEAIVSLKRLRAFFISALMHETIMTIVNRGITLEQFLFFMIQGFAVYLQRMMVPKYIADKIPKIVSIVLTMVFLSLTSKLFLCPFLRFESQALLFSQKSFI